MTREGSVRANGASWLAACADACADDKSADASMMARPRFRPTTFAAPVESTASTCSAGPAWARRRVSPALADAAVDGPACVSSSLGTVMPCRLLADICIGVMLVVSLCTHRKLPLLLRLV